LLLMSGYPGSASGDLETTDLLEKPFTPAQLLSRVRQALEATR
jgi:DNA-binding response OmpR family regulator